MNIIGKISVFPKLPAAIERLHDVAFNLWWSWETEAQALFAAIDPEQWEAVSHNPVKLLDFIRAIESALGKQAELRFLPMQAGDVEKTKADIETTQRDLGFDPSTQIEEGLKQFTSWYQSYYK